LRRTLQSKMRTEQPGGIEAGSLDEKIIPVVKSRKPIAAFFLALFFPGLGQLYNGQPGKGFLFFVLSFLIQILFCRTVGIFSLIHLCVFIGIVIAFRIYTMADAVRNAKKQKEYVLKRYNTAVHYIVFAIIIMVSAYNFNFITTTGYQTFIIPSTGNAPTLQVKDRFVADMEAFENKKPAYGDFVIFKRADGMYYVFRVVGLPNDKIEMEGNLLIINGKKCESKLVRSFTSDEGPYMTKIDAEEWEELLPNGHKHLIYRFTPPPDSTKANMKDITVPVGSYFLLGDNRSNALDSRYEGFVKEEEIEGQLLYSYWGNSLDRININLLK
jgi:signal peptidase I